MSEAKEKKNIASSVPCRVYVFTSSFSIHFACSTCIFNFNGADGNKQWAIIVEKRVLRTL